MRIVVLHNRLQELPGPDDADTLVQAEAVTRVLAAVGHDVRRVEMDLDLLAARDTLLEGAADVIFNLVETLDGTGRLVHVAGSLLDRMGLPYTGSHADALYLTSNKIIAKTWLRAHGLPVPDWQLATAEASGSAFLGDRVIVKSVWEHASVGLDDGSVIDLGDDAVLGRTARSRRRRLGGSAFIEAFVEGREFNVALLQEPDGWRVLPIAEMRFEGLPHNHPRIVGYDAKWKETSAAYAATQRSFEFTAEDRSLLDDLSMLSLECMRVFDIRGYARVDFRVSHEGHPFILEVNANPCIAPDAGFMAAAERAGYDLERVVGDLVACATDSGSRVHPPSLDTGRTRIEEGIRSTDRRGIWRIVEDPERFTPAESALAIEVVDDFLQRRKMSSYRFLAARDPEGLVGFACFGPTPGTRSRFDLYWIGVAAELRGKGIGRALLSNVETRGTALGGTHLQIETSAREVYRSTRHFYESQGYSEEAVLHGFYGLGDDKVIYGKRLGARAGRTPSMSSLKL